MVLDPEAGRSFFALWRCIDAFVCSRTGVLPGTDTPEQMHGASVAEVVQIRTVLWDELERVLRTRRPPRGDVDRLVFQNIVACYKNDDIWYRPNELLVPAIGRMVGPTPQEPS